MYVNTWKSSLVPVDVACADTVVVIKFLLIWSVDKKLRLKVTTKSFWDANFAEKL
jgi:hypothetical protein